MLARRAVVVAFASLLASAGCDSKQNTAGDAKPKASDPAASEHAVAVDAKADAAEQDSPPTQAGADVDAKPEDKGGLAAAVAEQVNKARIGEEDRPVVQPGAPIIAKVGEVAIPKSTFDEIYDLKVKKYSERGRDIPETAARRYRTSIIGRLVYNELIRQAAAKQGVDYDRTELRLRSEQQKRGIRDWDKHLERRGETEASLTALYITELREKALLEALGLLEPSKADIEADYEKIRGNWKSDDPRWRASHILVPFGEAPEEGAASPEPTPAELATAKKEAKARADEIYKEAIAPGVDFAELARTRSIGPSATKGGDIGIFTADRMAEEFSKKAAKMKVGDVSEPVETKFGYHVIKLTGAWPPGELPLSALEDQIRDRLYQRNLHRQRRELKDRLQTETEIVWFMSPDTGDMMADGIEPPPEDTKEDKKGDPMDEGAAEGLGVRKAETKTLEGL